MTRVPTTKTTLSAINEDCKRVGFALAHSYKTDVLVDAGLVEIVGMYGQTVRITDKGRKALAV